MGLKLTKKKGSQYWYVRGTVLGVEIFESTKIPHGEKARPPAVAEAYRLKREGELQNAEVYGRKHDATYLDLALSYLQAGGSPRFLGECKDGAWTGLIGKMKDKALRKIDQQYLDACASELYPGCAPQTVNRQFWTPFIATWNHGTEGRNPLCSPVKWTRPRIPKKPRPRTDVPYESVIRFINECELPVAKILFFLFWTGARPEEAFTLTAEHAFPEQRWASLTKTKTDMPRGIPLHPCLIPLLTYEKEQAANDKDRAGHIFVSRLNKPYAERKTFNETGRLFKQGGGHMKTGIKAAQRRSGLQVTPYNARHTVATYLIWPGNVEPRLKDEITGHASTEDMTNYYVHLPRAPLIDAIKVLPDPRKMGLREDLWKPSKIRESSLKMFACLEK